MLASWPAWTVNDSEFTAVCAFGPRPYVWLRPETSSIVDIEESFLKRQPRPRRVGCQASARRSAARKTALNR